MSTTATDPAVLPLRERLVAYYGELIDTNRMLYAEHPSQRYLDEIATCETRLSILAFGAPNLAALMEAIP